jgi:hypothetical protein
VAGGPPRARSICNLPRRRSADTVAREKSPVRVGSRQAGATLIFDIMIATRIQIFFQSDMKWTELFVSWSPLGTYFTTVHRQGVRLWGCSSFETQEKFAHPYVMLFDFSPCEQYLVTWSQEPIVVPEGALQGMHFPYIFKCVPQLTCIV